SADAYTAELVKNESWSHGIHSSPRIKRIRGSFDIFALAGKEEFIRLRSWPDSEQNSVTGSGVQGASEISPALATHYGTTDIGPSEAPLMSSAYSGTCQSDTSEC
ncbi:hypothetical protein LPJ66_008665, partial [Kickxella alabastrina]